jgi:hypothetical protein
VRPPVCCTVACVKLPVALIPKAFIPVVLVALALLFLETSPPAQGAVSIARFSMTPSTTRAGGHPSLNVSISFDPPTSDARTLVTHLPAGLTANARAAPFCSRSLLIADLCPLRTKLGSVGLLGQALGFEADVERNIYNTKPAGGERLRLGVPLFGSLTRGGVARTLLANPRPGDGGLDFAVAGPPREVAGYPVRLKALSLRLKGVVRRRIRGHTRKRYLLTNPRSCVPAQTVLEVSTYDEPPIQVSSTSTFTPTGCR